MRVMPSSGREVNVPQAEQLISTTNLKGQITYANEIFCQIAGFTLEELVGKPHNLVRHSDMPKEAFANLWDDLQNDRAWRGIVKNRCKNGDHYWVDAYVTPIYENGQKVGYQSVRVSISDAQKEKATRLYQALNDGKAARLLKRTSANTKALLSSVGFIAVGTGATFLLSDPIISSVLTAVTAITAVAVWPLSYRRLNTLKDEAQQISSNALIKLVFCDSSDEFGDLQLAMGMQTARNRTVLGRLTDINGTIKHTVEITDEAIQQTNSGISQQEHETDMVAAAIDELASATQEIAQNTNQTSEASQEARISTQDGREALTEVVDKTHRLVEQVKNASVSTADLEKHTKEIENVLSVINDIADQTNLLALNAAIEAARAGEHGRGFAVVSDEVRTLATRTQNSTQEIKAVITHVQAAVANTVQMMDKSQSETAAVLQATQKTDEAFVSVEHMMSDVSDRCLQIATASEEQTAVVEEIQKNVISIRDLAGVNKEASQQTSDASKELHTLVNTLESMVKAFEK